MKGTTCILILAMAAGAGLATDSAQTGGTQGNWSTDLVTPVANRILFESPTISSELRPICMHHRIIDNFIGCDVNKHPSRSPEASGTSLFSELNIPG
jgi:hypothetical protein